jgi:hypothetical protein
MDLASPAPRRPLLNPMPCLVGSVEHAVLRLPHRQFSWSKPPGLPCRRSRRQSDTILNATRVPTPSSPHDCALHLNFKPPPRWSKPPGLPCRRSRRQSDTILNATRVPTPSSPHDCALHLNPPPLSPSPCPPMFSVVCFFSALVVSDVGQAFQPALAPLPTALCPTQCHAVLYLFIMMNKITTRTGRP